MFDGKFFVTSGVLNKIPTTIQNAMWGSILEVPEHLRDYLQIFELKSLDNTEFINITHTQEINPFEKHIFAYLNNFKENISCKIFVIDDSEYATMILADEY